MKLLIRFSLRCSHIILRGLCELFSYSTTSLRKVDLIHSLPHLLQKTLKTFSVCGKKSFFILFVVCTDTILDLLLFILIQIACLLSFGKCLNWLMDCRQVERLKYLGLSRASGLYYKGSRIDFH